MPVSVSHYIEVASEIIDVEIPLLLGPDIPTDMCVMLDFDKDQLSGKFGK